MIGVFDSGVGGLTVVKEIRRVLPQAGIIYFGDTARYPYGNKSQKTIIKYALENTEFLLAHRAKIIVVGCNTASALAIDALRAAYPAMPIFEVVGPAAAAAVKAGRRIGVMATRATVNSGVYEKLIKAQAPDAEVFSRACPLLVPLVEENWLRRPETKMIVRAYLQSLKQKSLDSLILGCTHYPLLKPIISAKIGKRVRLIDSAAEVVKEITNYELRITNESSKSKFYFSDLTDQVREIAKRWLGEEIRLEEIREN